MDSSASSMGRAEPSCVGPILGAQAMEARWRLFQMLAVRGEEMLGSGIFPGADLARLAMGVPSCNIPTMPNVYLIPTYLPRGCRGMLANAKQPSPGYPDVFVHRLRGDLSTQAKPTSSPPGY